MKNIQKFFMFLSLIFIVICLIASIAAAIYCKDATFYWIALLFLLAAIWFAITIYKSFKEGDNK